MTQEGCSIKMSSSKGGPKGKGVVSSQYGYSSGGPNVGNNQPKVDQLSRAVADVNIDSADDGNWETFSKKNKNRVGSGAAKQWGPQNSAPKAWGQPDVVQKLGLAGNGGRGKAPGGAWQGQPVDSKKSAGRGNAKAVQSSHTSWGNNAYMAPPPVIAPPLQHGWQWKNANAGSYQSKTSESVLGGDNNTSKLLPHGSVGGEDSGSDMDDGPRNRNDVDEDEDDDDMIEDSDDDFLSDDFDSDGSVKSHETRKKNKWFKPFFDELDNLSVEQINEPARQWHCPACKNGPGAIDWYRGLQPLMAHAKTKGAIRVKLHRELAELLDEELNRKGTSVMPSGEAFGKWKGLRETVSDHEIVWPPMIVIMNTKLEQDENDKWIGMGNQELLEYFSSYKAVKARHAYGPQGHRGMSLLIFESSAMGYLEAERLHKHFADQGTDRDAWDHRKVLFYPGGKRQLYGYMARKEDLDIFNQHSQGKARLKFEMRSYHEMVVGPMKQMSEDNELLIWFKNKVAKEQRHSKALEESLGVVSEKLRKTKEENRIVRQRTKMQHEQNKEEMDYQEQFFKDQINIIHEALEEKEKAFEELLQVERNKVKKSTADSKTKEDQKLRREEVAKFIQTQAKGIEEFEAEREKLIKTHEDKKVEMKKRHMEEEVELEKEFETALTMLMERYTPHPSGKGTATTNS